MPKNLILIALPAVALAGAVLLSQHKPADPETPAVSAAQPAGCRLLSRQTVAASHTPPPTLAEFDALLGTIESRAQRLPTTGPFLHEAANRRLQRFGAMREVADLDQAWEYTALQLRQEPENNVARARRAAIHLARHQFNEALLDALATLHYPLEFDARFELGQLDAAREVLSRLPEQGLGPRLRHARMADHDGDAQRAAELIAAGIQHARETSLHPLSLAGILAQAATLALHSGAPDRACALYAESLSLHPQHTASLEWLGRWAWHRGEQELAVALLQRASELEPHNAARLAWLAELHTDAGATGQAANLETQVLELARRWPRWNRLVAARQLATAGEAQAAAALLAEEAEARQGVEYWHAALDVALAGRHTTAAEAALQSLHRLGAGHPEILYSLWQAEKLLGRERRAAALLAELVSGRVELSPLQWRAVEASQSRGQR